MLLNVKSPELLNRRQQTATQRCTVLWYDCHLSLSRTWVEIGLDSCWIWHCKDSIKQCTTSSRFKPSGTEDATPGLLGHAVLPVSLPILHVWRKVRLLGEDLHSCYFDHLDSLVVSSLCQEMILAQDHSNLHAQLIWYFLQFFHCSRSPDGINIAWVVTIMRSLWKDSSSYKETIFILH